MANKVAAVLTCLTAIGVSSAAYAGPVNFTNMTLNGTGVSATAGALTLNDGVGGEASSAFLSNPYATNSSFSGSFVITLINAGFDPQADGVTFLFQNDPGGVNALGTGGGGVGALGLSNSFGIVFQSWDNNHVGTFSNGDVFGGSQALQNFNLGDQNDFVAVSFNYTPGLFNYTATNTATGQSLSESVNFDLTSLGPTAYIGFTGGTGLSYATQTISNFDLKATAAPEPTTWALMVLGFGFTGIAMRRRVRVAKHGAGRLLNA